MKANRIRFDSIRENPYKNKPRKDWLKIARLIKGRGNFDLHNFEDGDCWEVFD